MRIGSLDGSTESLLSSNDEKTQLNLIVLPPILRGLIEKRFETSYLKIEFRLDCPPIVNLFIMIHILKNSKPRLTLRRDIGQSLND